MIIISDTTPLRYLAVLGRLDVLRLLFGSVRCPRAVFDECCHPHAPAALRMWMSSAPEWLLVDDDPPADERISSVLDAGEAAAITLALGRMPAVLLLMDERRGRRLAESFGLPVAGTINILALAGRRGLLDFQSVITELRERTNFHVRDDVISKAWQLAGESEA
jgi:predicted nucleic acid-binding protein